MSDTHDARQAPARRMPDAPPVSRCARVGLLVAFVAAFAACGRSQDKPALPPRATAEAPVVHKAAGGRLRTTAGEAHVGLLIPNAEGDLLAPSHYCVGDTYHKGAVYRLGRVNLFTTQPIPTEHLNRPVIVYGRRAVGLDRKLTRVGPCPPADDGSMFQMRSDWSADELIGRGQTTWERLAEAPYIEAAAVYPLPMVQVGRDGDVVRELVVSNPFNAPLVDTIQFSLYYEDGSGKPMPHFLPRPLNALPPGGTTTIDASASPPEDTPASRWTFTGYQIKGQLGDVRFDLLVSL